MTTTEIAWLAGLLEGEGCFRHSRSTPTIDLKMADQDVIAHAARLLQRTYSRQYTRPPCQTMFRVGCYGDVAISWMLTLYQFMGVRRRGKIREVMTRWRTPK